MTELEKYQWVNSCETLQDLQNCILNFADENGMIQGRERQFKASTMSSLAEMYYNDENVPSNVVTRLWIKTTINIFKAIKQLNFD